MVFLTILMMNGMKDEKLFYIAIALLSIKDAFTKPKIEGINAIYPKTFDIEEFSKKNTYSSRLKYAENNLTKIASGSSRTVYKIDNETVLKIAKNNKGLAQNELEAGISTDTYFSSLFAKVYDVHPEYEWIEMQLANKAKKSDFKKILGYDFETYSNYIKANDYELERKFRSGFGFPYRKYQNILDDDFAYEMIEFMHSYDMSSGDLTRISSYGIIKENNENRLVLIDFGASNQIIKEYYGK